MADRSVNKVTLLGNLGKDPELKVFEGGNKLARFPLATSESYTNRNGEKVEQTDWHNVVARAGYADVADKYIKKGDKVYVEGRIKTRSWEDRTTQQQRYITEIIVDDLVMLSPPPASSGGQASGQVGAQEPGSAYGGSSSSASTPTQPSEGELDKDNTTDDDLPF